MNVKKLIEKGYFPKELPPPFTTEIFAAKAQYIHRQWNNIQNAARVNLSRQIFDSTFAAYSNSKYLTYSLAKGIYSRRKLGIINPKQYYDLSKFIVDNWRTIRNSYELSSFSTSIPVEAGALRAVRTKSISLNNFKFQVIEESFNKKYELRLDIAQFYPSIYTHSIPWGILGRDLAKRYFTLKSRRTNWQNLINTDSYAKLYEISDKLDTLVRNCQEKQSVGLPIGPDTSFILAEVIGNRIDAEIKRKLVAIDYSALRYYDDYYFYTNSYNDAVKILEIVQQTLNEFQLEINDRKVKIKELPFSFESEWISQLSLFKFKKINKYEIRSFFAIVFSIIEKNRDDSSWIIVHALGRFEYGNIKIKEEDWDLFLNLLIKTLLIDASHIDKFLKIILSYLDFIKAKHRIKISTALHRIIEDRLSLNHSFEVSWALWIMKSLNIKCNIEIINSILNSEDYISQIICLDLIKNKLTIGGRVSLSNVTTNLNADDLFSEKWLFTYEAVVQGWLTPSRNIIQGNKYFKLLFDHSVMFYDSTKQIETAFSINPPRRVNAVAPLVVPRPERGIIASTY